MSATGFTKARSMGPVADAVERAGGSVARVFRRAELPLRLIEQPEQLILLKDQLALVECAAQEIDDAALPLRLSMQAGMTGLGSFGSHVRAAPTFREAIRRCNEGIGSLLQTMTHLRLEQSAGAARWTYEIADPARIGRQKNELLAFGYMVDALRCFCGPNSAPMRVELPGDPPARERIEEMLGCEISRGEKAAVIFGVDLLDIENARSRRDDDERVDAIPSAQDFVAGVDHLIRLGLLERRPTLDYVRRRLGLSARTLQRRLAEQGASFDGLRQRVLMARADDMLRKPDASITQIAFELGYSDPAHFSRAFAKWTGASPRKWRAG